MSLVEGHREEVARWILAKLPDVGKLPGGFEAIGVARDGSLIGGCIYTNWRSCPDGGDIQMWAAGEPGWLSRKTVAGLLAYPLLQLGCHRITTEIGRKNRKSRTLVEKIGFRLEGVKRHGLGPGRDLMMYGLIARECRWIIGHGHL